jgi:photosystem II stability/assembly factor-like uncharacterized protein
MRRCVVLAVALLGAACSPTVSPSSAQVPATPPVIASPAPTAGVPSPTVEPPAIAVPIVTAVAFSDLLHGVVVGGTPSGRAAVWRTADGGQTWTETILAMAALSNVAVAGSSAWATVTCANPADFRETCSLIASSDGGQTWRVVSHEHLGGLSFIDHEDGWSVRSASGPAPGGVTGGVLSTTNGGRTWKALPASPCQSIGWAVDVSFVSRTHGWVACAGGGGVGEAGKGIAETTDGGRTWTIRARANPTATGFPADVGSMELSDYLDGISIRPSGVGLAWEGRGGTLRTTDGGRTWTDMPPGGSDAGPIPQGGQALTDRDWFILLWDGDAQATILYATRDAGTTWQAVSQIPSIN